MKALLIQQLLRRYIEYYGEEVHMTNHMLKVYSFARNIAVLEGVEGEALSIIEVGSILHDIGIKESLIKYSSAEGIYQEKEGAISARGWLEEENVPKDFIDRVCYLIGHHHSYDYIDNIDFQILVEADFLVNIDENGMSKEHVKTIKDKYFKTETGKKLIDTLYLI
jgi:HD superfamily phosphodiesterase